MPEEINRIATDLLSDFLFTTEESANKNLRREGIGREKIHFVGNCMVDRRLKHVDVAGVRRLPPWEVFAWRPGRLTSAVSHRPSNVDDPKILKRVMEGINGVC